MHGRYRLQEKVESCWDEDYEPGRIGTIRTGVQNQDETRRCSN